MLCERALLLCRWFHLMCLLRSSVPIIQTTCYFAPNYRRTAPHKFINNIYCVLFFFCSNSISLSVSFAGLRATQCLYLFNFLPLIRFQYFVSSYFSHVVCIVCTDSAYVSVCRVFIILIQFRIASSSFAHHFCSGSKSIHLPFFHFYFYFLLSSIRWMLIRLLIY